MSIEDTRHRILPMEKDRGMRSFPSGETKTGFVNHGRGCGGGGGGWSNA